jgi:hypothetical protein
MDDSLASSLVADDRLGRRPTCPMFAIREYLGSIMMYCAVVAFLRIPLYIGRVYLCGANREAALAFRQERLGRPLALRTAWRGSASSSLSS